MTIRPGQPALTFLILAAVGCGASTTRTPSTTTTTTGPVDADGDGLVETDACPCRAEDADGLEDEDGCPDVDDDGDMILDVCDACPREAEHWNGHADDDGCPEDLIVVDATLVILRPIPFPAVSSRILPEHQVLVDEAAHVLLDHPDVHVRVVGHADGGERRADVLATTRAEAVRDALIARGVPATRITIESRGTTQPLDERDAEDAHALNRRVSFELEGPPAPPPPPVAPPSTPTCPRGEPPAAPEPC